MDFSRTAFILIAAVAAVAAALVTGVFSLTTLIVSKEDKVTDSRQKWLEGLREETAKFLGTIDTLLRFVEPLVNIKRAELKGKQIGPKAEEVDQIGLDDSDLSTFREGHAGLYSDLNDMRLRFLLRLDQGNEQHLQLIKTIDELTEKFYGPCTNLEDVRKLQSVIIKETQKIIDETWDRVKVGGVWFQLVRYGLIGTVVVVTAALVLIWYELSSLSPVPTPAASATAGTSSAGQAPSGSGSGQPSATQPPPGNAAGQAPIGGAKSP